MNHKESPTPNPSPNTREDDAGREHDDKAQQVAQAGADSQRGFFSDLENIFQNPTEVQLQLLRQAVEESNEAIIIATGQLAPPGPQIVYVNPAFTKMTGYALEDVIGKTLSILLGGPKTDLSAISRLREDIAAGKVFHGEMINYHKDGSELCLDWTGGPVRNERGEVTYLAAALRDVTEVRQVEEKLRRSEAQLRDILHQSITSVYVKDLHGHFVMINRNFEALHGMTEAELKGKTTYDVQPKEIADAISANDQTIIASEMPHQFEEQIVTVDGPRDFISVKFPLRDESGRFYAVCGISTDITARKQAEAEREELLAREQAARADAEHSAESIRRLQALTDSALERLTLDDLLREMLARIRELLATDAAAILLLTEDGQSLSVCATNGLEDAAIGLRIPLGRGVAGSIAANRAPLVVEDLSAVEVINPVLRRNIRSLIGAPLIVEGRLIGVIHADTAQPRRFTEDDVRLLRLAADRVALAIEQARLYEVERQARRQAEEANRMKDEFLTLVSHELRSPLNAILGYAALLRYGGLDAQRVKQSAEVIERSGKAQAQLIDDLLDTARIISGKLRLELGPVDLVSVIKQTVQTIYPAADAKEISIETNLSSEIGQITGDPARFQQVVWNLLSNAIKFTPKGGHVEARLERVDPHICITVSDTGKGIGPDFLPYVFDRFSQSDASKAKRSGGLGLGLALVKYLVELHGGTIEAASAGEGQGATFRVTLPVRAIATPAGEAARAPATVKSSSELAGVRALVVDDEDDARNLIGTALIRYGAEVVAVSSAAEAYTLITTIPPEQLPDVMVIDIGMPCEDGYSLIRRVREWERARGAQIPAVALTAYGRIEDRMRALNAGFQMHVTKPVEPGELAAVITRLIRRPNDAMAAAT
jgi:PAS domain S-box-containing protein